MNALEYINNMNHGVVSLLGSGKTFKSGTMYTLLDSLPKLKKRKKAFFKFPSVDELFKDADLNVYSVNDLWDVEPDSILIIEDANRVFPSRSSSKTADLQEFLGVISHKDILIFLTVQNTSNTDIAFFRDQDVIFLHKKMNLTAIKYEREEFRMNCTWSNVLIDQTAKKHNIEPLFISYVSTGELIYLPNVPTWYNETISHALRDYDNRLVA